MHNEQIWQTYVELGNVAAQNGDVSLASKMFAAAEDEIQRMLDPLSGSAAGLNDLARSHAENKDHKKAIALYKRVLASYQRVLGKDHLQVARILESLADIYIGQEKYLYAEPLYKRLTGIYEKVLGHNSPLVADRLLVLAWLWCQIGKYDEADAVFKRVDTITRRAQAS